MKNKKIIQNYDQIRNYLIDKGTDYFEAQENIASLDAYLVVEIVDELVGKMTPKEIERLNTFTSTKPTPEQICLFLGISIDEFEKLLEEKLSVIVQRLP